MKNKQRRQLESWSIQLAPRIQIKFPSFWRLTTESPIFVRSICLYSTIGIEKAFHVSRCKRGDIGNSLAFKAITLQEEATQRHAPCSEMRKLRDHSILTATSCQLSLTMEMFHKCICNSRKCASSSINSRPLPPTSQFPFDRSSLQLVFLRPLSAPRMLKQKLPLEAYLSLFSALPTAAALLWVQASEQTAKLPLRAFLRGGPSRFTTWCCVGREHSDFLSSSPFQQLLLTRYPLPSPTLPLNSDLSLNNDFSHSPICHSSPLSFPHLAGIQPKAGLRPRCRWPNNLRDSNDPPNDRG